MGEGAASERDRGKIGTAAALGRAPERHSGGEGERERAGPGRQGEKEGRCERTTEAEGIRASALGQAGSASVGCAWPAGGLRSALAGPVGLAGA